MASLVDDRNPKAPFILITFAPSRAPQGHTPCAIPTPSSSLLQWDSSSPRAWILWLPAMIPSKFHHVVAQHKHLSHRKR